MKFSIKLLFFGLLSVVVVCFSILMYQKNKQSLLSDTASVLVINVLAKEQFDDCHIKGSIHVDLEDLDRFEQNTSKNTKIVVYCSNYLCSTSDYVAEKLKQAGFKNVFVYPGGMAEWFSLGLPFEGPAKGLYLRKKINPPTESDPRLPVASAKMLVDLMSGDREKK